MKKITIVLFAFLLVGQLCAQTAPQGFKTHASGVMYRCDIEKKNGAPIEQGDMLFCTYAIAFHDSVLFSNLGAEPQLTFSANPTFRMFQGDLMDGLMLMKEGEQYTFAFPYDSIKKVQALPEFFKPGQYCFYTVNIARKQTEQEAVAEAEEKQRMMGIIADSMEKIEEVQIRDFLKQYNIDPTLRSNIYYHELVAGEGNFPQEGQEVHINYEGRFLDGKLFDTSVEEVAKAEGMHNPQRNYAPLPFKIGSGMVIGGFDAGVRMMKKGGKAMIVIPSKFGYGSIQVGSIPPYSTLVFTLELVEIQ